MSRLRKLAHLAARTPLHPQWLLGRRKPPEGVTKLTGKLLDIGAADCWIKPLLPACVQYIALDYPATGREMYAAKPDVFADAARLPFPDNSFEGVTCLEVLEHVPDPVAVMREIGRVLKPGGHAWISMPFLYPLHDAPFDFQRYTRYGLQRDVKQAALEIVSLRRTGHAMRTAGLLACLALAGGAHAQKGWRQWIFLPLALPAIPMVNLSTWLLSHIWPDWTHMASGHELKVIKP